MKVSSRVVRRIRYNTEPHPKVFWQFGPIRYEQRVAEYFIPLGSGRRSLPYGWRVTKHIGWSK